MRSTVGRRRTSSLICRSINKTESITISAFYGIAGKTSAGESEAASWGKKRQTTVSRIAFFSSAFPARNFQRTQFTRWVYICALLFSRKIHEQGTFTFGDTVVSFKKPPSQWATSLFGIMSSAGRYNTLDFPRKVVCQKGGCPLWKPLLSI